MPFELHGVIRAKPGQGAALLAILEDAARNAPAMPGCRSYVVRASPGDEDTIEVDEVWDDQASHDASLTLETVRDTIRRARPHIASMASR
jgi:quinol monooxygenase YgiN